MTSRQLVHLDTLPEEDAARIDRDDDLVSRFEDADRRSQEDIGNVVPGGVGKAEFLRGN